MLVPTIMSRTEPQKIIPSWSSGTDVEIANALIEHYAGRIDLTEYWSVGDERQVTLSASDARTYGLSSNYPAQTITLVLMNEGGLQLTESINGHSECVFVVGLKESLYPSNELHTVNSTTIGYKDWASRSYLNGNFRSAFPSALKDIFKQFKNVVIKNATDLSVTETLDDYFAFPAEKQVFGTNLRDTTGIAEQSLSQFEYYQTSANRVKSWSINPSTGAHFVQYPGTYNYWTLRTYYNINNYILCVDMDGSKPILGGDPTGVGWPYSPFGCI